MGDGHAGGLPHQPIAEHDAQRNGLAPPCQVSRVEVSHSDQEVRIFLARAARPSLRRSECESACVHTTSVGGARRSWRGQGT